MNSIMSLALAGLIIPCLSVLRRAVMSSHFVLVVISLSYFLSEVFSIGMIFSHFPFGLFVLGAVLGSDLNGSKENSQLQDHVDIFEGNGPKVAAYVRISKKGQSDFSLDAQVDAIIQLKEELKPSELHWFFDQRSSKSAKDFDKLKINKILTLGKRKEIQELWVFNVDRMGRVCRKLIYFFLEFSEDGGIIRTPEKEYGKKDLKPFMDEADAAEKANQNRAKAIVAAKARSFKQRHWNKGKLPLGYRPLGDKKDAWLQKNLDFEPLIKEVYRLFLIKQCLSSVSNDVGTFHGLLSKPLTPKQIRRILTDPTYIGKPQQHGVVVVDPDLAFIDEESFRKSLDILLKIKERCKPKRMGPLEKLAVSEPITFLQMLDDEEFELHHRGCGGVVVKNGTTHDEGPEQQLLKCNKCRKFWRLPHIKAKQSKRQAGNSNFMGSLKFDNPSLETPKKNNRSSNSTSLRRPKTKQSSPANDKISRRDLLGHPIKDSAEIGQKKLSESVRKNMDENKEKQNADKKGRALDTFWSEPKKGYRQVINA